MVKFTPLLHLPTFAFGMWLARLYDSEGQSALAAARVPLALAGLLAIALVVRCPRQLKLWPTNSTLLLAFLLVAVVGAASASAGIYAAFTTRSAPAEESAEGAAAQDPSSPGFMNRMEDRWRRRSEGE